MEVPPLLSHPADPSLGSAAAVALAAVGAAVAASAAVVGAAVKIKG